MEEIIAAVAAQLKSEGFDPPTWRQVRARAILATWPVPAQLEAHSDASNGNPAKLEQMQTDVAAIKAAVPKD